MALGLTSSGSTDDLRLVIEGKISELGHELCNVQVKEYTSDAAFELWDESGGFLTTVRNPPLLLAIECLSPSAIIEPPPVKESHEWTKREASPLRLNQMS